MFIKKKKKSAFRRVDEFKVKVKESKINRIFGEIEGHSKKPVSRNEHLIKKSRYSCFSYDVQCSLSFKVLKLPS